MRLGLGNNLTQKILLSSTANPAAAYIAAITAAGATVTAGQESAISTFISGEVSAGRWDKIKRLYFPVWQLAAANEICMKSLTSGTFNGSILHEAKGVRASGSTGNMNTNTNLGSLGVTNTSFHFALLMPNGPEEDYSYPFSVNDTSYPNSIYHGWSDGSPSTVIMEKSFENSPTTSASVMTVGNDSVAGNLYLKERTSVGVNVVQTIASSVTTAFPANNLFIIGLDNNGAGSMNNPIGAFSVSTEFSSTQDTAYTATLKTLWETTTGLTLA